MKKIDIIFCILILTILLFFGTIGDFFYGNPISKYMASKRITNYINDNLNIKKYEIKDISKNFKSAGYSADIYDEDNNTEFSITSTEKNVLGYSANADETNYSFCILGVSLIISFILFMSSSFIYIFACLLRSAKRFFNRTSIL